MQEHCIKITIMNRKFYLQVGIQHQGNSNNVHLVVELDYSQVFILEKTVRTNAFKIISWQNTSKLVLEKTDLGPNKLGQISWINDGASSFHI